MDLTIRQSVEVGRPAKEVFAYVSDFGRAREWRVEVRESTLSPPGSMGKGSRMHEVAAILGRRVATDSVVEEFEPGRRFTFRHVAGPIPVGGEYLVETAGNGARLTYTLTADLRGIWRVAGPYLRWSGPRMMARSLRRLQQRLGGGTGPPPVA